MNEQDLINQINGQLPDNKNRQIKASSVRSVFNSVNEHLKHEYATKEQMDLYASSGIIGVYDSSKIPSDYSLFDSSKINRFIVASNVGFSSSSDWGSLSFTTQELKINEAYLIRETSGVWLKHLIEKRMPEVIGIVEEDNEEAVSGGEVWAKTLDTKRTIELANNLFVENENYQNAVMPVKRFLNTGVESDLTPGSFQSVSGSGVLIDIPASGSAATSFFFDTGFVFDREKKWEFNFTVVGNPSSGSWGISWYDPADSLFKGYHVGYNGIVRRRTNSSTGQDTLTLTTYTILNGDVVKITYVEGVLSFYLNSTLLYTLELEEMWFVGKLYLNQNGFSDHIFQMQSGSSDFEKKIIEIVNEQVVGVVEEGNQDIVNGGEVWAKSLREDTVVNLAEKMFESKTEYRFGNDMTVKRYIVSTGAVTDFPAGTYQTHTEDGVAISIPASGSASNTFYFETDLILSTIQGKRRDILFTFKINDTLSAGGVGLSFLDGGEHKGYNIAYNGIIRKRTSTLVNTEILYPNIRNLVSGDIVAFHLLEDQIIFYINEDIIYSTTLPPGWFYDKSLFINPFGFIPFRFSGLRKDGEFETEIKKLIATEAPAPTSCFYSYNLANSEFFVYSHLRGKDYVRYRIKRETDMDPLIYQDYWRLVDGYICNYIGGEMVVTPVCLLEGGENECVFKQNSGKRDFTGGYHGDELVIRAKFFAGGVEISDLSENIPLTACQDFAYSEYSSMHETAETATTPVPIPGHPIVAYHDKLTEIKNGGYTTKNKLTWNFAGLVTLWYQLSCVAKAAATRTTFNPYQTSDFLDTSGTQGILNAETGQSNVFYYGDNYSANVDSQYEISGVDNSAADLFVNARAGDTKYYRNPPSRNVTIGEVWESEMEVKYK